MGRRASVRKETELNEPIISVSGLRGIVGQSLTPEIAARYAAAFVAGLSSAPVVVTRDGRSSGAMLADALHKALTTAGRDVLDAGIAATPTTGVLVSEHAAAGGIQITASHNPAEYNGLKLFSAEGRVLSAAEGQSVVDRYRNDTFQLPTGEPTGRVHRLENPIGQHLSLVIAIVDVQCIAARKFKVLLDANHGSGSLLGRRLLADLGCEVTVLGDSPDGQFAHPPEPTAENLSGVSSTVASSGADVCFCQDPDADRLAVIDEKGCYLGEEYTLAMCVDHVLRNRTGPIVTNCSTSRMSEDLAMKYGVPFYRSSVGEANVVDVMLAHDAVLGGEGNGGVIDPRVGLVRDSFVGMALLLEAMATRDVSISEWAAGLPRYEICKTKITLPPEKIAPVLAALEKHFADATADYADGLRLDWPGRWLLVRPSNTEPIVRAIAEAETAEEARHLCDRAGDVLQGV